MSLSVQGFRNTSFNLNYYSSTLKDDNTSLSKIVATLLMTAPFVFKGGLILFSSLLGYSISLISKSSSSKFEVSKFYFSSTLAVFSISSKEISFSSYFSFNSSSFLIMHSFYCKSSCNEVKIAWGEYSFLLEVV